MPQSMGLQRVGHDLVTEKQEAEGELRFSLNLVALFHLVL